MSSYKSAAFRFQQQPDQAPGELKYRPQAQQLREFFPDFSVEDLCSLLLEVGGDVQHAAQRISEGHAEQWGSVKTKKEKKLPVTSLQGPKDRPPSRDRTDSRGGRGGRGHRGGPARGPRGRGSARSVSGVNGHASRAPHPGKTSSPAPDFADKQPVEDFSDPFQPDKSDWSNGISAQRDSPSDPIHTPEPPAADPSLSLQPSSTPPSWGASPWAAQDYSTPAPQPISAAPRPTKLPATPKRSWAQVARPQEKPAVAPPPVAPPAPPPVSELAEPAPALLANDDSDLTGDGWEDPITVQPPTWDDEPQVKPPPEDAWSSPAQVQADIQDETSAPLPQEEPVPEIPSHVHSEPVPAPQQPAEDPIPAPTPSKSPVSVPPRSSAASHRSVNKYKATDQAVVMPTSSFNPGLEKVGMQFGSLSLGGDVIEPSPTEPAPASEPALVKAKQSPQQPIQPLPQVQAPAQESPAATSPVQSTTAPSQIAPQQQAAPPAPAPAPTSAPVSAPIPQSQASLASVSHTSISTSVSQPIISSSPAFSHQPQASIHSSLSQHQQQAPLTQHPVPTHQFTHHSLPAHLDTQNPVQQSQHAPQPSQPQASAAHSAYFRQAEAPYFHTPTPPAGQGQDYNIFGQIGQQHPSQASHLGAFANNDYGYGDNQRGFYDSYAQSSAFGGSRTVLGHDDVKGLSASQQHPGNAVLAPSSAQSSQLTPQGGAQPQPSGGQGPQQSYPPPVPYYYPYPQNQYYGTPYNSGYGVPQQFVKYPTMFQPGPPAQGAAPSPGAKQGPGSVQSQSDHYGRGLYGQQHQLPASAYDDLGYQHHAPQHNHAPAVNNLTSSEYSKHPQLYGGQAIQSFMGLGQGNAAASGPPLAQRGGGTSPETPYKPYSQNVGVKDSSTGVGVGQGVGQPQSGRGVQQAHTQGGFYGGNRFGSSAGSGGPQAQQGQQATQGPQGHVGYPQGNSDASFYQYQPRQQQGYW